RSVSRTRRRTLEELALCSGLHCHPGEGCMASCSEVARVSIHRPSAVPRCLNCQVPRRSWYPSPLRCRCPLADGAGEAQTRCASVSYYEGSIEARPSRGMLDSSSTCGSLDAWWFIFAMALAVASGAAAEHPIRLTSGSPFNLFD